MGMAIKAEALCTKKLSKGRGKTENARVLRGKCQ